MTEMSSPMATDLSTLDFDHADNGKVEVVQVAIQDWKDGLIISERFVA